MALGKSRWHVSLLTASSLVCPSLEVKGQDGGSPEAQRIEVRSDRLSQRQADTSGRQVVGRSELLRHGDASLSEAIRRVPGITVDGRGQAMEIKLGGLGVGYTQILLNGDPVPRGFSIDSIPADSVDRVEIVRGASVQSSQAIAGTINIVTRRSDQATTRELKLSGASQWGRPQASASLNLGARAGAVTWGLGLVASSDRQQFPAEFIQERREGTDSVLAQRILTRKREFDRTDAVSANPRASWQRPDGEGGLWQLSTDHSIRYSVSDAGILDERATLIGAPPAQSSSVVSLNYERLFWRGRVQGLRRGADGAEYEGRLSFTLDRRDQRSQLLGSDFLSRLVQDSRVDGMARDHSVVLAINHKRPVGDSHRLVVGGEVEQARRQENRVQVEQELPGGLPPDNLDERYDARIQRRALYVQDNWSLGPKTEVQLGARLESMDTDSQGNVFDAVRQSHHLLGPVLRFSATPGGDLGTFKLGLSRGFRLPTPRDVMPRRFRPIEVSPTTPVLSGNPSLRPERALSLDGSWQKGGVVVSAALRRIDDVILDQLIAQPDQASYPWLLVRFNGGRAWTASLELEVRSEIKELLAANLPLRLQASLALNRSRLSDVAADRPALAGQPLWELKLDASQSLAGGWTANVAFHARGKSVADQPSDRRLVLGSQHRLGADLAWQRRPKETWRLSVSQLLANDDVRIKSVRVAEASGVSVYDARESWRRGTLWRVGFESAF